MSWGIIMSKFITNRIRRLIKVQGTIQARLIIFGFVLLALPDAFGQKMLIHGNVVDTVTNNTPENVVIMAVRLRDSVILGHTKSDSQGQFRMDHLQSDTVEVLISSPNTNEQAFYFFPNPKSLELKLPNLILPPKSQEIEEIVIYAFDDPIYFNGDTLVYTADSFNVKQNAVVEDLLKKLPGIKVDKNGKISSQGTAIDKVLVDGDEFFGNDPTVATKNLGANAVENVEVYETKNEDAEAGSDETIKVMNLKLKEDAKKGYFGRIAGATDFIQFHEGEILVNRFKGDFKLSVFGLATNTPRSGFGWRDINQFGLENPGSDQRWSRNWGNNTQNNGIPRTLKSGFYYSDKLTEKVEVAANYTYSKNELNSQSDLSTQFVLPDTTYRTDEKSNGLEKQEGHVLNLHAEWQIDSLTKLAVRPSYTLTNNSNTLFQTTDFVDGFKNKASTTTIDRNESSTNQSFKTRIELNKKFKKPKRELIAKYNFNNRQDDGTGFLSSQNKFYNNTGSDLALKQKTIRRFLGASHGGSVQFTEPLTEQFSAVIDYNGFHSEDDPQAYTYNFEVDEYSKLDSSLSNDFVTTKFSNRLGGWLGYKNFKIRTAAGIRLRNVRISNNNLFGNNIQQNINNWLPFANFRLKFSNSHRFNVRYETISNQPSIRQLQPVTNNQNPNRITIGNSELQPSIEHSLTLYYNKWKAMTGQYVWIWGKAVYKPRSFGNETTFDKTGRTISRTINVSGNAQGILKSGLGIPLLDGLISVDPQLETRWTRSKNWINGNQNITDNLGLTPELSIEFDLDTIGIDIGMEYNYNVPKNSLSEFGNQPYSIQNYYASLSAALPFKFDLNTEFNYTINGQLQDGYNLRFAVWNLSVSRRFLKKENLILSVEANDIFNQNVLAARTIEGNAIIDNRSTVISRYVLARLTYKFRNHVESKKP